MKLSKFEMTVQFRDQDYDIIVDWSHHHGSFHVPPEDDLNVISVIGFDCETEKPAIITDSKFIEELINSCEDKILMACHEEFCDRVYETNRED